jgi:hypothetical protein
MRLFQLPWSHTYRYVPATLGGHQLELAVDGKPLDQARNDLLDSMSSGGTYTPFVGTCQNTVL